MDAAAWAVAGAGFIVAAALVALTLAPLSVHLSGQARGDPSGAWAAAGGIRIAFVAVALVAARDAPATAHLLVFGRRVATRRLRDLGRRARSEAGDRLSAEELRAAFARLERHLDPLELVGFLLRERRRIELADASLDCEYSFADVALTGKVLAALCVLDGALPPWIAVRGRPGWEAVDRASLALSATLRLWPGRAVVDTAVFLARRARWRRAPGSVGGPSPAAELGGAAGSR
ncbi:MAG: hypothetical protein IT376_18460 [Polyangiaceae bacterium]|nr:hypothetical protein [Polyangiaceae bacterium]